MSMHDVINEAINDIREKEKEKQKLFGCIGWVSWTIVILLVGTIWRGWVLCKLWEWFVVPTFHVDPLTLVQTIGLALLAFAIVRPADDPKEENKTLGERAVYITCKALLNPAFILLMGWIVKHWL